jgi:hypothetical protein
VDVPVTWPDSSLFGPTVGSLRQIATDLEAAVGDQLLIELNRQNGKGTAVVVRSHDIENQEPYEKIAVLTGLPIHSPNVVSEMLIEAVGATDEDGLVAQLRRRREDDLLGLLAREASPDLDDAFDRLRRVL